ncbi:MAG TPA: antiporter, partial [Candidatus Melainabacteria bacterium]|nr:antiporter [Candidatus Melainabacteria bacterium]
METEVGSEQKTFRAPDAANADIRNWNPEDEKQWGHSAKKIADRNLWISIPCLLCGFAVWMYWGVITV